MAQVTAVLHQTALDEEAVMDEQEDRLERGVEQVRMVMATLVQPSPCLRRHCSVPAMPVLHRLVMRVEAVMDEQEDHPAVMADLEDRLERGVEQVRMVMAMLGQVQEQVQPSPCLRHPRH